MKNTKTELRFFTIAEWEEEAAYLRGRHQKGWKLVSASLPGVYHFAACEPEDVIYQLDYNPEGQEHRDAYIQMYADCGWEYLQDLAGYSLFRKPAAQMTEGSEEIFSDDSSRLEMMRQVFHHRMVPLLVIFLGALLPIMVSSVIRGVIAVAAVSGAVIVTYLITFYKFAVRYYAFIHKG